MSIFTTVTRAIAAAATDAQHAIIGDSASPITADEITITQSKRSDLGHFSTTLAFQLAKSLRCAPLVAAEAIVTQWRERHMRTYQDIISDISAAPPGFINIRIQPAALATVLSDIHAQQHAYGDGAQQASRVIVEFVSANPNGPLHIGHGRGAAFGASLANILRKVGHQVHCEYYVNDAGRQMDILTLSVWLRYLALPLPPLCYQGEYVHDIAAALRQQYDERFVRSSNAITTVTAPANGEESDADTDRRIVSARKALGDDQWQCMKRFATDAMLAVIRDDLDAFDVHFDAWFSEQQLYDSGALADAVKLLGDRGHTYNDNGALWFRATTFGDEKDRVLIRENGQPTYFAADIAYHLHKARRADMLVDIFGADHHGYTERLRGALSACGIDNNRLHIALVQFAALIKDGEKVSMSTRAGEFVPLRWLINEVGCDAARYFYSQRRSDQHMEFDINVALQQNNDNPVYYIQYAHARICAVLRKKATTAVTVDVTLFNEAIEQQLLLTLLDFPSMVNEAATSYSPHILTHYLHTLAGQLHSYYTQYPFIVADNVALTTARLHLIGAVKVILSEGLRLLGVNAPDSMPSIGSQ